MADKKFVGPAGAVEDPAVAADFEAAQKYDKLKVGKLGVYYKDGFKTRYFAYDQLERAFIRVQDVNARMCCGQASFSYARMVLVSGGKEYADVMTENEKALDEALAAIAQAAPGLPIGVPRA